MTDRHSGYLIVLEHDIREDDVTDVITALKQIRGVIGVEPIISGPDIQIAQMRADTTWRQRLIGLLERTEL